MGMRTEDTGQTMAVQHSARVTEMEDEVGGEVAQSCSEEPWIPVGSTCMQPCAIDEGDPFVFRSTQQSQARIWVWSDASG